MKQILARVGGEPQLRKERHNRLLAFGLFHELDSASSIERRIRHADLGDSYGGADKAVAVKIKEFRLLLHTPVILDWNYL